jgi:hypothetical protein
MKLATAIRHRLGQILAHQAEQREAVDLLLAEGCLQPAFDALHHLGHDAVQGAGKGCVARYSDCR